MNTCKRKARRPVALGLFVLASLGMLFAPSAFANDVLNINFAMSTPPATYLLPHFVAIDLGWYEKAGLKVTEQVVSGDVNSMRAVISGGADLTEIGPVTIMQGYLAGGPLKIIGALQPIADYWIVARTNTGNTLADLKDKRWASISAGSMSTAIPRMVLQKHGIDTANMQFLSVGGMSARLQAVVGDKVDATILDTYFMVTGRKTGNMKAISSVAEDFPGLGYAYAVTTKDVLADPSKHKALEVFIRGGIEGVRFIQDNPQQAAEILAKRLNSSDVSTLIDVLKQINSIGVWGVNGGLERTVFDFSEKTYRDNGDLTRDVTYEELVDPSIVDSVIAAIGKK